MVPLSQIHQLSLIRFFLVLLDPRFRVRCYVASSSARDEEYQSKDTAIQCEFTEWDQNYPTVLLHSQWERIDYSKDCAQQYWEKQQVQTA